MFVEQNDEQYEHVTYERHEEDGHVEADEQDGPHLSVSVQTVPELAEQLLVKLGPGMELLRCRGNVVRAALSGICSQEGGIAEDGPDGGEYLHLRAAPSDLPVAGTEPSSYYRRELL